MSGEPITTGPFPLIVFGALRLEGEDQWYVAVEIPCPEHGRCRRILDGEVYATEQEALARSFEVGRLYFPGAADHAN